MEDRDFCEFCCKDIATRDDGEMSLDDPRTNDLCWSNDSMGYLCVKHPANAPLSSHPDKCRCDVCGMWRVTSIEQAAANRLLVWFKGKASGDTYCATMSAYEAVSVARPTRPKGDVAITVFTRAPRPMTNDERKTMDQTIERLRAYGTQGARISQCDQDALGISRNDGETVAEAISRAVAENPKPPRPEGE